MVEVVFVPLAEPLEPQTMRRLLSLVPVESRRRFSGIRSASAREQSLVAHVLARHLACRSLGVAGDVLAFRVGEDGKPFLKSHPRFHFNVSHTRRAVAAAASCRPVGVDIEGLRPARMQVADRFFTAAEQAYVRAGTDGQDRRFFTVWTRKEAYLKWSGNGIRVPLTSIETTAGVVAGMLRTAYRGDLVLSVCGNRLPEKLEVVPMGLDELLQDN